MKERPYEQLHGHSENAVDADIRQRFVAMFSLKKVKNSKCFFFSYEF